MAIRVEYSTARGHRSLKRLTFPPGHRSHIPMKPRQQCEQSIIPSELGPTRIRALAVGAQSLGAVALGAIAVGTVAICAVVIGRLFINHARIRKLYIDELVVGKLRVRENLDRPAPPPEQD